jgi:hypothetical protein
VVCALFIKVQASLDFGIWGPNTKKKKKKLCVISAEGYPSCCTKSSGISYFNGKQSKIELISLL